jgi:hypothetical protein
MPFLHYVTQKHIKIAIRKHLVGTLEKSQVDIIGGQRKKFRGTTTNNNYLMPGLDTTP